MVGFNAQKVPRASRNGSKFQVKHVVCPRLGDFDLAKLAGSAGLNKQALADEVL